MLKSEYQTHNLHHDRHLLIIVRVFDVYVYEPSEGVQRSEGNFWAVFPIYYGSNGQNQAIRLIEGALFE